MALRTDAGAAFVSKSNNIQAISRGRNGMHSRVREIVLTRCAGGHFLTALAVMTLTVRSTSTSLIEPRTTASAEVNVSIFQASVAASGAGVVNAVPACILQADPSATGLPSILSAIRLDSNAPSVRISVICATIDATASAAPPAHGRTTTGGRACARQDGGLG